MTLQANSFGVVSGEFTVPDGIPAGTKRVLFAGSGGSFGEALYAGQGTLVRRTFNSVTTETERWWSPAPPQIDISTANVDPLAQTFVLAADRQVGGVDLWFTAKGATEILVQIRSTTNGIPNRVVMIEKRVKPSDVTLTGPSRIAFDSPLFLRGGEEYALVILCNDGDTALAIAELGKYDSNAQRWVTAQAYQVGVLLSSANASTWTAHQERDLAFRLLACNFTQTERTIDLGTVPVVNATDLLLMAYADESSAQSRAEYLLTLPDTSVLIVADGQPVRLAAPLTGNINIKARLKGTATSAPVLHPGTQLVVGTVDNSAEYVTVGIKAGASSRVRVIFEAEIPSGATATVQLSGVDVGDTYSSVTQIESTAITGALREYVFEKTGVNEDFVRVKITLGGTSAVRPVLSKLRVLVM